MLSHLQSIADDEKALTKAEQQHAKAMEQVSADESALAELRRKVKEAKAEVDKHDAVLNELKKRLNTAIQKAGSVQKRISAEESSLEQMKNRRHNLFHRCKVEEIRLPLRSGEVLQPTEIEEPRQTSGSQEPMEDQSARRVFEKEDAIELDFSQLSKKQKELSGAAEYASFLRHFTYLLPTHPRSPL